VRLRTNAPFWCDKGAKKSDSKIPVQVNIANEIRTEINTKIIVIPTDAGVIYSYYWLKAVIKKIK